MAWFFVVCFSLDVWANFMLLDFADAAATWTLGFYLAWVDKQIVEILN